MGVIFGRRSLESDSWEARLTARTLLESDEIISRHLSTQKEINCTIDDAMQFMASFTILRKGLA